MKRVSQWIAVLLVAAIVADSTLGGWGAGCARGQFGPIVVSGSKKKATSKSKSSSKPTGTSKAKRQPCPGECECACNDHGKCECFDGEHCGCRSCPCGLTGVERKAAIEQRDSDKAVKNFGVELNKLHKTKRQSINGKPVSREMLLDRLKENGRSIEGGKLDDDSMKLPITAIGANREQVTRDIKEHAAFASLRDNLLVQGYAPDNWAVSKYGFKTDGKPTIYLQDRDGRVLLRRDDYAGGPELLAKQVGEAIEVASLRRRDPNYDGKSDPDGTRPIVPAVAGAIPAPIILLAMAVAGLGLAVLTQRKGR